MRYYNYCKIDRTGHIFMILFTALIGLAISFWFIISRNILVSNNMIAKGPCFVNFLNVTLDNREARQKAFNEPDRYSGYSVIVDTVYTHESSYTPKKPKTQETMIINGKEYILR